MKILLWEPPIGPHDITAGVVVLNEPLGLEAIAAGLLPHHEVRISDLRLDNHIGKELEEFQPHIVGTTSYTAGVYTANRILREAKNYNPHILTVVGGHHPTMKPEDFNNEFIDAIVLGEGEITFKELVNAYDNGHHFREVPGLALPGKDKLFFTQTRPLIADLDTLPFPARNLTQRYRSQYFRGKWRPIASLMTSRGCPYRCNFCAMWKIMRGKYRMRSAESVADELAQIEENYIDLVDDNTLHDVRRAQKLYEVIKERGIRKKYKLYARSDTVVREPGLMEKWKEIGMEIVLIGFESFTDENLQRYNKGNSVRNNEEAIHILHQNGIEIAAYFLIEPNFTTEDFDALAKYVERMNLLHPVFTVLTPFPGTDLFQEKYHDLTTHNYELFDFFHSVFPTKLPLKQFHQCLADLWRRCYPPQGKAKAKSSILSPAMAEQLYRKLVEAYRDYN